MKNLSNKKMDELLEVLLSLQPTEKKMNKRVKLIKSQIRKKENNLNPSPSLRIQKGQQLSVLDVKLEAIIFENVGISSRSSSQKERDYQHTELIRSKRL